MENINTISRKIICAIFKGLWMNITYKNNDGIVKKFFIAIKSINLKDRSFICDSLSIDDNKNVVKEIKIFLDRIQSVEEIPNTFFEKKTELIDFIEKNVDGVKDLFPTFDYENVLKYLSQCFMDDISPTEFDYAVIEGIDLQVLEENQYVNLTEKQIREMKKSLIFKNNGIENITLGVNVLSLISNSYKMQVLAYKPVQWEISENRLRLVDKVLFCGKFKDENGEEKNLIDKYLYEDEKELLNEYTTKYNEILEKIKSRIKSGTSIIDTSKLISIKKIMPLDIESQFDGIRQMYCICADKVAKPIQAFFGEFDVSRNRKHYSPCFVNANLNPSQVLSIFCGLKDDVSFIQGPPGTGKTQTVINLVTTAFFNELTCLVTTNNNQPMKDLIDKFNCIGKYNSNDIELPICRLSAKDKMKDTIIHMNHLYKKYKNATVYEDSLKRNANSLKLNINDIVEKLNEYDDYLINKRINENVKKIASKVGADNIKLQIALSNKKTSNINFDFSDFTSSMENNIKATKIFLYYSSAKYLQRLDKPKYGVLKKIIAIDINNEKELTDSVESFLDFLKDEKNIDLLLDVFPIILSTNLSSAKIGTPKQYFDVCIMDEAGQCNIATSLISILRAKKLILVGDPQQLQPVITLEESNNKYYKEIFMIDDIFDYKNNSIYSTMIANAPRCQETLLNVHYRCVPDIIEYCNQKYYENMLEIKTSRDDKKHLFFENVDEDNQYSDKNVSYNEVKKIIGLLTSFKGTNKSIGVITPYVSQQRVLKVEIQNKFPDLNITCGTIHTFQGNEKDIIIFSTVINKYTKKGTYNWLKKNKQLINVAVSRAKFELHMFANENRLNLLYEKTKDVIEDKEAKKNKKDTDDIFDLYIYIKKNGEYKVIPNSICSQALGTEEEGSLIDKEKHEMYKLALSIIQDKSSYDERVNLNRLLPNYDGKEYFDFVIYQNRTIDTVFQLMKATKKYEYNQTIKEICDAKGIKYFSIKPSESRSYFDIKEFLKNNI